jgi:uncharacterized protein (DUF3820 family)
MGNNKILMNFGKYKNQSIDKVFHDKYYYNWIIKQDFFKQQYQELYNALINYKEKPKINFDDLPNDIRKLIFTKRYDIMKQEKEERFRELVKEMLERGLDYKDDHKDNYERVLYDLKYDGFNNLWFLRQKWKCKGGHGKDNNILDLIECELREKFYKSYNYRFRNHERYRNLTICYNSNILSFDDKRKYNFIDYEYFNSVYESDSDSD